MGDPLLARQRSMCAPTSGRTDKQKVPNTKPRNGKRGGPYRANPTKGGGEGGTRHLLPRVSLVGAAQRHLHPSPRASPSLGSNRLELEGWAGERTEEE